MAIAALAGGILLTVQATDTNTAASTSTSTVVTADTNSIALPDWNHGGMGFGRHGFGGYGPVEVSTEFEQKVTDIAKNDSDVQNLLADGYNVTSVRPIIKTVVDGDGNVVTKATSAILMLQKDTTGQACVLVDLEQAKVTQIVILTRTVIDKP